MHYSLYQNHKLYVCTVYTLQCFVSEGILKRHVYTYICTRCLLRFSVKCVCSTEGKVFDLSSRRARSSSLREESVALTRVLAFFHVPSFFFLVVNCLAHYFTRINALSMYSKLCRVLLSAVCRRGCDNLFEMTAIADILPHTRHQSSAYNYYSNFFIRL